MRAAYVSYTPGFSEDTLSLLRSLLRSLLSLLYSLCSLLSRPFAVLRSLLSLLYSLCSLLSRPFAVLRRLCQNPLSFSLRFSHDACGLCRGILNEPIGLVTGSRRQLCAACRSGHLDWNGGRSLHKKTCTT